MVVIPAAVWALLKIIAWVTGAIFVSAAIRDSVTGVVKAVELKKYETIEDIMNDPNLTYEQKLKLIKELEDDDFMHKIFLIVLIIGIAFVFATYMRGK